MSAKNHEALRNITEVLGNFYRTFTEYCRGMSKWYSPVSAKRDNARNFNRDAVSAFLLLFSAGKVQPGRVATYE